MFRLEQGKQERLNKPWAALPSPFPCPFLPGLHPMSYRFCLIVLFSLLMNIHSPSVSSALRMMSSSTTSTTSSSGRLSRAYPYTPPTWAKDVLANVPRHGRLHLANAPTPVYELTFPSSPDNSNLPSWRRLLKDLDVRLWIKRDDMTGGCELGGNKIRKLEFLLADAIHEGYDSVITIGGEQSNHCRATAAASRMLGLQPHLILRTKRVNQDEEFGTTGNILFDRMVGSSIYMCTPGEYGRVGSVAMVDRLCTHLKETKNLVPYKIPVGGSNGLGSWGYIEGVDELNSQLEDMGVAMDHLVFACGSGGTAAGICLGTALSHGASAIDSRLTPDKPAPEVHAVGVCDDPEYFHDFVASISDEMGFAGTSNDFVRRYMTAHQGKGLGYASSTPEELEFVSQFAVDTGIVLDPVYSGKALYHFLTEVVPQDQESYRGKKVLFWHTGGALGLFDKESELTGLLKDTSRVHRLDVYGKNDAGTLTI